MTEIMAYWLIEAVVLPLLWPVIAGTGAVIVWFVMVSAFAKTED